MDLLKHVLALVCWNIPQSNPRSSTNVMVLLFRIEIGTCSLIDRRLLKIVEDKLREYQYLFCLTFCV